jgi:shikimate 5-dehydrogenase
MPPEFPVEPKPAPTLFSWRDHRPLIQPPDVPAWAEILGLGDARLVGLDLPINGPPEVYRRAVHQIRHDPLSLGGIVTTHKINTLNAARDLFDELTPDADLCGEVSCIYKHGGRLTRHATDPACSGPALQAFIPPGPWAASGADVLCLGAGLWRWRSRSTSPLAPRPADRPRRLIVVNRSRPRLDSLRALVETRLRLPASPSNTSRPAIGRQRPPDGRSARRIAGHQRDGMGKDIPGSPLTDAGVFPRGGFAWDLNYRGELDFLRQARAQAATRGLHVEDGWLSSCWVGRPSSARSSTCRSRRRSSTAWPPPQKPYASHAWGCSPTGYGFTSCSIRENRCISCHPCPLAFDFPPAGHPAQPGRS